MKLRPEQKYLLAFVGTWELMIDGTDKKGSVEIKPILGGRFITEDVKLPFLVPNDVTVHGIDGQAWF